MGVKREVNNMSWIGMVLGCILIFAIVTDPIIIPDSYEQAIVADCWYFGTSPKIDCTQITPLFRPPLPSLLLLPLMTWVGSITALSMVSFLATVAVLAIIVYHADRLFHFQLDWRIGLWVGFVLLLAGFGTRLPILLDSKWIALPWLFAGGGILMSKRLSMVQTASIALFFGLAFLCRLENILIIVLGAGLIPWKAQRKWWSTLCYLSISAIFVGGWMVLLWETHQTWTLSPRFWESSLVLLLDEMPLRWLQDLYGMGIWDPPFRKMAMEHSIQMESTTAPSLLGQFSMVEWGRWFAIHILGQFHPLHWLGILLSLPVLRHAQWRHIFATLVLLSAPSIAVTLLPQGRESTFPIVYILPMWVSIWLWTGLISGHFLDHFMSRSASLSIAVTILGLCWISPSITTPQMIEKSNPGLATQHWLNTQTAENALVISTFETAPIVWLANREWQEWPSPWSMQHRIDRLQETDRPIYAIVWNNDLHAWYSLSFTERYHPPIAYINQDTESFVVFDLSEALSEARPQNAF